MDNFIIAGKTYSSRLLVGTGKDRDFAQTRAAMTRGSGPMRALMARGAARARRGSKRRGTQPHSWQSPRTLTMPSVDPISADRFAAKKSIG